jgi:hypothetical protein
LLHLKALLSIILCPWLLTCCTCCWSCCAVLCCAVLCCAVLQFSVLRYESVIHEFDPYFNYRSTIKASVTLQLAAADTLPFSHANAWPSSNLSTIIKQHSSSTNHMLPAAATAAAAAPVGPVPSYMQGA